MFPQGFLRCGRHPKAHPWGLHRSTCRGLSQRARVWEARLGLPGRGRGRVGSEVTPAWAPLRGWSSHRTSRVTLDQVSGPLSLASAFPFWAQGHWWSLGPPSRLAGDGGCGPAQAVPGAVLILAP